MLSARESVLHLRRVKTPSAMPDVVPNVVRPRLEVRHEDMEVETENGPAPVGAGSNEVGPSMDTEGFRREERGRTVS